MITQTELKSMLCYDDVTGEFTWLTSRQNGMLGKTAGSVNGCGYITISIKNKRYQAHRLAFLYKTGSFPSEQVDHIDRDRKNNSWSNLRECSNAENAKNVAISPSNTSGFKGVTFNKKDKKWRAQANFNNKKYYLGNFDDKVSASNAYVKFTEEHHGNFYTPLR